MVGGGRAPLITAISIREVSGPSAQGERPHKAMKKPLRVAAD